MVKPRPTKLPGAKARKALTAWIKKEGVSVIDLALRVGCSRKTIYTYLWGTRRPSADHAIKLQEIAEISVSMWGR